jgi:hypothetical protein
VFLKNPSGRLGLGWLWLVGCLKLDKQVSNFAVNNIIYKSFSILAGHTHVTAKAGNCLLDNSGAVLLIGYPLGFGLGIGGLLCFKAFKHNLRLCVTDRDHLRLHRHLLKRTRIGGQDFLSANLVAKAK